MVDTPENSGPWVGSRTFLNALAIIWAVLTKAKLAVLVFTTVWSDLFGRAWKPIPVTAVGQVFRPGHIHLLQANTERVHRALAFFWKHHPEPTWRALRNFCAQFWPPTRPLVVSGALVFDGIPGGGGSTPLSLSVKLDLIAQTVALTHSSAGRGPPLCVHPETPSVITKMASLADVLAPLLGRNTCPHAKAE